MKKTLLLSLLFSLIMGGLFAQSLQLTYKEGIITNDQVVTVLTDPDDLTSVEVFLNVKNIGNDSISVKVKRYNISLVDETDILYCWGQSCYGANTLFPPDVVRLGSQQDNNSFHGDYLHYGIQGTSKVRFTFFDEMNPDDSTSLVIHYTLGYLGIDANAKAVTSISNVYPNPATTASYVDYKLPKSAMGASLRVSNLLGVTVMEIPLDRNEGKATINVSNLKEGIYFYSLIVNNSAMHTRKFVVKR